MKREYVIDSYFQYCFCPQQVATTDIQLVSSNHQERGSWMEQAVVATFWRKKCLLSLCMLLIRNHIICKLLSCLKLPPIYKVCSVCMQKVGYFTPREWLVSICLARLYFVHGGIASCFCQVCTSLYKIEFRC